MKAQTLGHIEKVIDWEDRIKDYPEELKQKYRKMWEVKQVFFDLLDDTSLNWRVCSDTQKKGSELKYEQTVSKNGMQLMRVISKSDHDPLTTLKAYIDHDTRLAYDRNVKDCKMAEYLGCNLYRGY